MKTYDERMQAILGKARSRKRACLAGRVLASVLLLTVVVSGVLLLPEIGRYNPSVDAPPVLGPAPTTTHDPTCSCKPEPTYVPTHPEPDKTPPTILPEPSNTIGPPAPNDVPSAYLEFEAVYVKTTQPSPVDMYPAIHLIRSVDALHEFCARRDQQFTGFDEVEKQAALYEETFFEEHSLIVLMIEESSGSVRHSITDIEVYANGFVNIGLERNVPEVGTCDMAYWYIFVEVDAIIAEGTWIGHEWANELEMIPGPEKLVGKIPEWELAEMRKAFVKQFTKPGEGYTAEDVEIERVTAVFDDRYVLFVDGIFGYLDWIETEIVNGYDFVYGSSQKMYLYYGGYYYRLQEACDAGLLSNDELQKLYDAYRSEYWYYYVEE